MNPTPHLDNYSDTYSFLGGATRAGVGGDQAQKDLSRALREIDGLFAGMKYYDATNSQPDALALELEALHQAATTQPDAPQAEKAWSSLRDVQDRMQRYWQNFVNTSQELGMPIIDELHQTYQDARGLRETGFFAFRNTQIGLDPNDIANVFAFCSLSYVVSDLLHERGRLEKTEILAGVTDWLNALKIPEEREVFKKLGERLWPEAHRHLHFHDLGLGPQQAIGTSRGNDYAPDSAPSTGLPSSLVASSLDPEFSDFSASWSDPSWSDLQGFGSGVLDFKFQMPALETQPYHDPSSGQFPNPGHDQVPFSSLDTTPMVPPGITGSIPNAASTFTNIPGGLRSTSAFAAVIQYYNDSGNFWYDLSGQGVISKDTWTVLKWNQEHVAEKRHIHEQYLSHLVSEKDAKDVPSRGIVSMVEALVEMGYLQSIEEAMRYMIAIGKVSSVAAGVVRLWPP
ncbi:hypothetical protein ACHAPT_000620 [Fusarium lateritium]